MSWWHVGAVANVIIMAAYLAIAMALLRTLHGRPWRTNPVTVATAGAFVTGALHHASLPLHVLLPALGVELAVGEATRTALDDWHLSLWDVLAAAAGVWCWRVRAGPAPSVVEADAAPERERQALEIHDNIVQGLATAKLAFELGDNPRGMNALDQTLAGARRIITELLGSTGDLSLDARDLRRDRAAGDPG